MINLIKPKSGDKILEIGYGWGGFAEYLGKKYDVSGTISKKQYEYAKERIHKCGLNEKVNIQIKDYRDLKDRYNSIASIEMIEAVGQNYLESYFKKSKALSNNGTAAIQAITIDDSLFDRYRNKQDLYKNIFFREVFCQVKIVWINIFQITVWLLNLTILTQIIIQVLWLYGEMNLINGICGIKDLTQHLKDVGILSFILWTV